MNLYQILENVKDGKKISHTDAINSILVLSEFLGISMINIIENTNNSPENQQKINQFLLDNYKSVLSVNPKYYLANNVPGNPSYDEFRKLIKKLIAKRKLDKPLDT